MNSPIIHKTNLFYGLDSGRPVSCICILSHQTIYAEVRYGVIGVSVKKSDGVGQEGEGVNE